MISKELPQNPSTPPESLPYDVDVTTGQSAEGWNIFRITPRRTESERLILYAHGGGFVWHMLVQHWDFLSEMAKRTSAEIIVPAYPLAPHGSTPKALPTHGNAETVIPKFAELLEESVATSEERPLTLMGDSAGGNIALAAAMLNRDEEKSPPHAIALLSPWLDLSLAETTGMHAPKMSLDSLRQDAEAWRGDLPLEDPLVSPIHGQLHNLGKIAVFCGTADLVYPGCERFAAQASRSEGTSLDYHAYTEEPHNNLIADTQSRPHARETLYNFLRQPT